MGGAEVWFNAHNSDDGQPSALGLLRAAVAGFLFDYKISQSYPHEFDPYSLSMSADRLNAALSPLIEAFNRDLTAYQRVLQAGIEVQIDGASEVDPPYDCETILIA